MKSLTRKTVLKATLIVAAVFGSITFQQTSASCAECGVENSAGIKKAFEVFHEQCRKQLGDTGQQRAVCFAPNVYNKILPILKALGKDNRFGPGDRIFLVGESLNATLSAGSTRIWQTAAPINKDQVTIKFAKVSPQGSVRLGVCVVGEDGQARRVGTINFEESAAAGERAVSVSGVQSKIVRIEIAASGPAATTKIQYSLGTS